MFDDLLAANLRYRSDGHHPSESNLPAKGLAVLTCIDARVDPLAVLGLSLGDAVIVRNAGARASDDAMRSITLAVHVLAVRRICVMYHTDCAVIGTPDDAIHTRIGEQSVADRHVPMLASPDAASAFASDRATIRASLPDVDIGGFVLDVSSRALSPVEGARAPTGGTA